MHCLDQILKDTKELTKLLIYYKISFQNAEYHILKKNTISWSWKEYYRFLFQILKVEAQIATFTKALYAQIYRRKSGIATDHASWHNCLDFMFPHFLYELAMRVEKTNAS